MFTSNNDYTVLDPLAYSETVTKSKNKAIQLLAQLQTQREQSKNNQIAWIIQQLINTPYINQGAMGEGDWQPASLSYEPGAVHVKQDPVYRFDGLDCQTLVQVVLALYNANTLDDFESNIIKCAYGAAGEKAGDTVRYYNRNNFIEGDWNKINRRNGFIENTTQSNGLQRYTQSIQLVLERQNWFKYQTQSCGQHVRVLADQHGRDMVKRFTEKYALLDFPYFDREKITMDYLPKEMIATTRSESFYPNMSVIGSVSTPAVVEFIRDSNQWLIGNKRIKDLIGTDLCVSHMGILYQQTFQKGDLIYLQMQCQYNEFNQKVCAIRPIYSQFDNNTQLMLAHATNARPDGYIFYQDKQQNYHVSAMAPTDGRLFVPLNRVEAVPLFHYLTDYQYGRYWYMDNASLLGIHLEQIN